MGRKFTNKQYFSHFVSTYMKHLFNCGWDGPFYRRGGEDDFFSDPGWGDFFSDFNFQLFQNYYVWIILCVNILDLNFF